MAAWLSKAESFLTALDETAATKIQEVKTATGVKSHSSRCTTPSVTQTNHDVDRTTYTSPPVSSYSTPMYQPDEPNRPGSYPSSRHSSSSSSRQTTSRQDADDRLFASLNETPSRQHTAVAIDNTGDNHPVIKANRQQGVIRELNEQITQLKNQLSTKESHLSVLKVRATEASDSSTRLTTENDSLRAKVEQLECIAQNSSANQSTADLSSQVTKLRQILDSEKSNYNSLQSSTESRLNALSTEVESITDERNKGKRMLLEEKDRSAQLLADMREVRQTSLQAITELDDYKQKAARVLAAREEAMRAMSPGGSLPDVDNNPMLRSQLDELLIEKEAMSVHCRELNRKHAQTLMDNENVRDQLVALERRLEQQRYESQDELTTVSSRLVVTSEQLAQVKQEQREMLDDQSVQHKLMIDKLKEKDAEIQRILNNAKHASATVDQSETGLSRQLEESKARQRHVTERMLQMQAEMEAARAELHACRAELERSHDSAREAERSAMSAHRTNAALPRSRAHIPALLRETPYDSALTRNVKRVYGQVDSAAVTLVGLVRHPIGRVATLVYLIVLHCWVMLILATYTPEMHDHNGDIHPPASG